MEKSISLLLSLTLILTPVFAVGAEKDVAEVPATVEIKTDPPGAEITIDLKVMGESPLKGLTLAPGEHVISTMLADYAPVEKTIFIKSGSNTSVNIVVEKEEKGIFNSSDYWWGVGVGGIILIVGVPLTILIALNTSDMG